MMADKLIVNSKYKSVLVNKLRELEGRYFINGEWKDIGYGYLKPLIAVKIDKGTAILLHDTSYFVAKNVKLIDLLQMLFIELVDQGNWYKSEMTKPMNQRSIIARYIYSILIKAKGAVPENIAKHVDADVENFVRLCYDIYILKSHNKLPGRFRKRLLNPDQNSKGFRNEIRLAAIFIEAGFQIEWKKSKISGEQIVEFEAFDKKRDQTFAIESKRLDKSTKSNFKDKVESTLQNAIEKSPQYPYFIFLDANLMGADFEKVVADFIHMNNTVAKMDNGIPIFIILTNIENNYSDNWTNTYPAFIIPNFSVFMEYKEYTVAFGCLLKRLRSYPKIMNLEKHVFELFES